MALAMLCHGPAAAHVSPGPHRVWGLGFAMGSVLASLGCEASQVAGPRMDPTLRVNSSPPGKTLTMEKSNVAAGSTNLPILYLHNPPSLMELGACTQN